MKIIKTRPIDGKEYRMFQITVFSGTPNEQTVTVAEESLNETIERFIVEDRYHEVRDIDEAHAYYVPQEIADDETEWEIIDSIESIMREDL